MSEQLVTIDITNGVADVRLNRPEKYNALSPDMFKSIVAAGETLAEAKDVRAVLLSGNGRGFCAGLDMGTFAGMTDESRSSGGGTSALLARDERPENFAQRSAYVWKRLPVPVISAIHGVAYGGGAQIALGADDPLAHALELANEIANKSPDAVRAGKQLLEASWHADERVGLELEARLQTQLIGSPNQVEAVTANFQKRPPQFKDPD